MLRQRPAAEVVIEILRRDPWQRTHRHVKRLEPIGVAGHRGVRVAQHNRQNLLLQLHREFESAQMKPLHEAILRAQAAFLESHKNFSAEIQGNCDERGSREYNLALGARRAEAVKQALVLLGVDGEKMKTVSFGSEKPVALGKDEESYTQNRRVDIVD